MKQYLLAVKNFTVKYKNLCKSIVEARNKGGPMRASWNGYFRLGDVVVPVRLYSAVKSIAPRFTQLHAHDHSPVTRVTICQKDGKELSADEIIKAVEYEGKLIEMTDSDLESSGITEKVMQIRQFSPADTIDSIYYDKPYYIVPDKGGELAYTVFRQAFVKTKKVAVVTYVLYEKEHLGIIRPYDGMLLLQQLRFAGELIARQDVKTPSLPQPSPKQVTTAIKLIDQYSTLLYVEDYRNEQIDTVNEIISRKAKGLAPRRPTRIPPHTTPENELIPKLQSLAAGTSKELHSF